MGSWPLPQVIHAWCSAPNWFAQFGKQFSASYITPAFFAGITPPMKKWFHLFFILFKQNLFFPFAPGARAHWGSLSKLYISPLINCLQKVASLPVKFPALLVFLGILILTDQNWTIKFILITLKFKPDHCQKHSIFYAPGYFPCFCLQEKPNLPPGFLTGCQLNFQTFQTRISKLSLGLAKSKR